MRSSFLILCAIGVEVAQIDPGVVLMNPTNITEDMNIAEVYTALGINDTEVINSVIDDDMLGITKKYHDAIEALGGPGQTSAIIPNGTTKDKARELYYKRQKLANLRDRMMMPNVKGSTSYLKQAMQLLIDERKEQAYQNMEANKIERKRVRQLQKESVTQLYQAWLAEKYRAWTKARVEFLKNQETNQANRATTREQLREAAHSVREARRNAAIESRAAKRALATQNRAERQEEATAHRIAQQTNAAVVRQDNLQDALETLEARWEEWKINQQNRDKTQWTDGKGRVYLDPVPSRKAVENWRIPPPQDVLNQNVLEYVLNKRQLGGIDETQYGAPGL